MNNSLIAGLLFFYIFVIQFLPLDHSARLAAQLSAGVVGVLVGFYLARLSLVKSSLLFMPIFAYFLVLILSGYDGDYVFFASFGLLVVAVFAATWYMRRR